MHVNSNKSAAKLIRSRNGQAMPYLFVMLVILIVSWSMMVNFSKLLFERMAMQNAADNGALSAAVNQARTLNMINMFNRLIASNFYDGIPYPLGWGLGGISPAGNVIGAGGGIGECVLVPVAPQYFINDVSRVGSVLDVYAGWFFCGFGTTTGFISINAGATIMRTCTQILVGIQEGIAKTGPMFSYVVAQKAAQRQNIDADGKETGAEYIFIPPKALSLGLKRNRQQITYCGTAHYYASGMVANVHVVCPVPFATDDKSWYFADESKFYQKKVTLYAYKTSGAASSKGYPLLGRWLGISWPSYVTIASAACFNRRGAGFTLVNGEKKSTDIRAALNKSEEEGASWQAHLVPVKDLYVQH